MLLNAYSAWVCHFVFIPVLTQIELSGWGPEHFFPKGTERDELTKETLSFLLGALSCGQAFRVIAAT